MKEAAAQAHPWLCTQWRPWGDPVYIVHGAHAEGEPAGAAEGVSGGTRVTVPAGGNWRCAQMCTPTTHRTAWGSGGLSALFLLTKDLKYLVIECTTR